MNDQTDNKIIEFLTRVHDRPLIYMLNDSNAACNFLAGFISACELFNYGLSKQHPNIGKYREIYDAVLQERGWRYDPHRPWREMQERGMDNVSMMQEGIIIEIEVIKRLYAGLT